MNFQRFARLLGASFLTVVVGCGGTDRFAVQGKVSFQGKALEEGRIAFTPTGEPANRPQASGIIKGGSYSIPAAEGPGAGGHRVEVFSRRKTGKKVPTPGDPNVMIDEEKESIPAEFNVSSKLTVQIEAGKRDYDFDLKK